MNKWKNQEDRWDCFAPSTATSSFGYSPAPKPSYESFDAASSANRPSLCYSLPRFGGILTSANHYAHDALLSP
jgi:hypothetical protein